MNIATNPTIDPKEDARLADLATQTQRLAAFASWFELEMPDLQYEEGEILLTDEVIAWMAENHMCPEWLANGSQKMLVDSYRYLKVLRGMLDERGNHVQWLKAWREACNAFNSKEKSEPEEAEELASINELSAQLAITPAVTLKGLAAQIAWFEEEFGGYVTGSVSSPYDQIFKTLQKGIENIDKG